MLRLLFALALDSGHLDLAPECKLAWQEQDSWNYRVC